MKEARRLDKCAAFVLAGAVGLAGLLLVALGLLMQAIVPKLGHMAAVAGRTGYSSELFVLDLTDYYLLAAVCIGVGFLTAAVLFIRTTQTADGEAPVRRTHSQRQASHAQEGMTS